jgi:small subunit ribosomal protein S11
MPTTTTSTTKSKPKKGSDKKEKVAAVAAPVRRSKKIKRSVSHGQAHILATYNNTIVTVTDGNGNCLGWASSGSIGFKGAKKSTPYAAGQVVHNLMDRLESVGLREVDVYVIGIGSGREAAIRAFQARGVNVNTIRDKTPIPHNGARARKARRV